MKLDVAAVCDLGLVRTNNEDMILLGAHLLRDTRMVCELPANDPQMPLVVAVADGMGGAAAGEVASAHVLQSLRESWSTPSQALDGAAIEQRLHAWADAAHRSLCEQGRADPHKAGMGTTVVGLLFWNQRVWRFHAGDSRLYRQRGALVEQLTQDHSAQMLEAHADKPRNVLANALGGAEHSYLECREIEGGAQAFDRFLLCSDGLHDLISPQSLVDALRLDQQMALQVLLARAHQGGGRDNISIVIVDVPRASHGQ